MNYIRLLTATILITVLAIPGCSSKRVVEPTYSARIMNAMGKMRPGDWVLYYVNKQLQVRMVVIDRDPEGVIIEYLTYFRHTSQEKAYRHRFNFRDVERNLDKGFDLYGRMACLEMKRKHEPTRAGDRVVDSEHWSIRTPSAMVEQWFANEIPIWGIVRQRRNSKNTLLLRAWGRAGEKVKWPRDLTPIIIGDDAPNL